jgi:hypothetical protein
LTCTVNVVVPTASGVPDSTPALESDMPAGRLPATVHVYDDVPPEADSVEL